jgi:peptide/nickel transport system permease protein
MGRYIVRRLLGALVVVWVVSVITFAIFMIVPKITHASPAYLYVGKISTPAQVKAVEHNFGLDLPIPQQYVNYVTHIIKGYTVTDGYSPTYCRAPCFGYSFRQNRDVTELLKSRFTVTLGLAIGASILWLVGGVSVGIISALKRGTWIDRIAMIIALAGVSLPVYFTGLMLLTVFSYGPTWLRWVPDPTFHPFSQDPVLYLKSMILPWISLAFLFAALYARLTRASMLDTMGEDYIRTARAKGLSERKVISKHALRSALTPIVTIFGLDLAGLLGGAILTEKTFSLPGLGALAVDAIAVQDLPVIMGVTIVGSIFIVVANVIVDLLYGVVDPRVTYK